MCKCVNVFGLLEINHAFSLLRRDLLQTINRPVQSEVGETLPGMLSQTNVQSLEFTHHGRYMAIDPIQTSLQRTRYILDDGGLYRETWDVLDRVSDTRPQRSRVITGVKRITFEFIGLHGTWPEWPYFNKETGRNTDSLPLGVVVHLEIEPWQTITRKFLISG